MIKVISGIFLIFISALCAAICGFHSLSNSPYDIAIVAFYLVISLSSLVFGLTMMTIRMTER